MIVIIRKALFPKFTYITALLRVFESDEYLLLSNLITWLLSRCFLSFSIDIVRATNRKRAIC